MDLATLAARILGVLKLGTPTLVAALLVLSALIFGPPELLARLGIPADRWGIGAYLGLGWLGLAALLVVRILAGVGPWIGHRFRGRRALTRARQRLHELTPEEQAVLYYYLANNTRTQPLRFTDGVVRELEAHGIISRASQLAQMMDIFPYNIQPWAWDYLRANPHLLAQAREGIAIREGRDRRGPPWRGILDG